MANGIRTGDTRGFNKGCNSKFRVGSRVRQTPEEGWRTYQPKRCGNNNKDKDNSPKTLNDKNQASSQKFRQQITLLNRLTVFRKNNFLYNDYYPTHDSISCTWYYFLVIIDLSVVAIEKGASRSPSTTIANLTTLQLIIKTCLVK